MITTLAALLLAPTAAPPADGTQVLLQPERYASPSVEYVLAVDPNHREGVGPGRCVMTRRGEEVWAKELPVTLWEAAVTDRGYAGGFAYSAGYEERNAAGSFHVLILSPSGEVLLNQETVRTFSGDIHTPPDPRGNGVLASDHLDRLVVRIASPDDEQGPVWKAFRLSTGEALGSIVPQPPELSAEGDRIFLRDARAVPGTPLTLVWWWYIGYGSKLDWSHWPEGAVFTLHDPEGRRVWSFDRRASYTVPGDRKAQSRLGERVRDHGVILEVTPAGSFTLWDVGEEQSIEFVVLGHDEENGWRVERGEAAAYAPASKQLLEPLPEIELRHLDTVELKPETVAGEVLDDPCAAYVDRKGRVLVRDEESGAIHVFDGNGACLFVCRPEPGDFEENDYLSCIAVDHEGAVHLANALIYSSSPRFLRFDGEGRRTDVLDFGSAEVVFDPGRPVRWVDLLRRNGTVRQVGAEGETLAVIARRPDRRWVRYVADFDVTRDGTLVLLEGARWLSRDEGSSALAVYDREGTPRRTIPLPEAFSGCRVAASARWILVGSWSSERLLVRVRDGEALGFDPCRGEENDSVWAFGFSPDEWEVWGVEVQALKLHRYALPD